MKTFEDLQDVRKEIVASFAEAWIENLKSVTDTPSDVVASFAEAWIENHTRIALCLSLSMSPPSRGMLPFR